MTHAYPGRPSLRFLLVEDQTVAAIALECILEDLGHSVIAAAVEPRAAERALAMHGDAIDAVILGADLVGISSLTLARHLRGRGIPCAVSSRLPEPVLRALGFTEPRLEKPFRRDGVMRLVPVLVADHLARAA